MLLYMTVCSVYTESVLAAAPGGLQLDLLTFRPPYFLLAGL